MKKYCVIQLGDLADLFQTKRLILSLSRNDAKVHICVSPELQAAALYLYPETVVHIVPQVAEGEDVSAAEWLQSEAFDAVYNLHGCPQNMNLFNYFAPGVMHGYWRHKGREYRSKWLTCLSRVQGRQRFLNAMDMWAHLAPSPIPSHMVNPIAMRKGGGIGVALRDNNNRVLPISVLAGCINSVCTASRENDVVLFGEKEDEPLVAELLPLLKDKIAAKTVSRCFETTFEEDMEIISTLDMLVTPESTLMHAAAHVGTPVNAFFHSSAWCMANGPYGLGHRIWQADIACAPCNQADDCSEQFACMHVFGEEQLQRFLAGKIDKNYPAGVTGYVSMLDEVGVTYMPVFGTEEHAEERLALRGVASEFVGITKISKTVPQGSKNFYAEQDWLLSNCVADEEDYDE
ncbi:glycosyltransferase family 9 protein [Halodesulfovibrio marinisediminis]|uniref:ADP-heptose:LPS heptosyltransferase n=1 Tax=Halodesulfovibrio marinisediminis DSM 17456 TaxID=1121457 RepID=A0A1N6E022_9BACT|nr:glycosyltransferase family 9 protein [Halodesulfovibrio marinisediminis]SIN76385.1 ADP-heptose:LPS heptosyltransferase [Halodesulfovibrio marinisediminis DSM 17456]